MKNLKCLNCSSKSLFTTLVKSGFDRKNRQRYQCKTCLKIFTGQEKYHRFSEDEKATMIKMKQEGLSTRAIGRVLNRDSHFGVYLQLNDYKKAYDSYVKYTKNLFKNKVLDLVVIDEIYTLIGKKTNKF